MALIVQQKALHAATSLQPLLLSLRKRDRELFDQVRRAMHSVVLNLAEADGNDPGTARARFASACGSAKEVRAGLGWEAQRVEGALSRGEGTVCGAGLSKGGRCCGRAPGCSEAGGVASANPSHSNSLGLVTSHEASLRRP